MQIVAVDILGPFSATPDVVSDCFTKWVGAFAMPNQEAALWPVNWWMMFLPIFPPKQLHADQGRQFEADLVKEICSLLQINKTHSTAYGNGLVERFNRTLLDMLATLVKDHQVGWDQWSSGMHSI